MKKKHGIDPKVKGKFFWLGHVSLIVGVSVSIFVLVYYLQGKPESSWDQVDISEQATAFGQDEEAKSNTMALFEIRLAAYERKLQAMNTNLKLQGLLALIAVGVILSGDRNHKIGFTDTLVPAKLLLMLLPLTLMFLWLQFGYLLNHLIDSRLVLYNLSQILHEVQPKASKPEEIHVNIEKLHTTHSVVNDGGFLDAWFRAFLPNYVHGTPIEAPSPIGNKIALFLVYGSLLGGAHAAMLSGLQRGLDVSENLGLKKLYRFALVFFGALLVLTHVQFFLAGSNKNWQHIGIAFFCVLFIWVIKWILAAASLNEAGDSEPVSEVN